MKQVVVNEKSPMEQYAAIMSDATSYNCQWGTNLEIVAFSLMHKINISVYQRQSDNACYDLWFQADAGDDTCPSMYLLFESHGHYQLMDPTTIYDHVEKDRKRKQQANAEKTDEERKETQKRNKLSQQKRRVNMPAEKADEERKGNTLSHQKRRVNMPAEKADEERKGNTLSHQKRRVNMSAEKADEERKENTAARKKARHNMPSNVGAAASCNLDEYNPEDNSFGEGKKIKPFKMTSFDKYVCDYCHAKGYGEENKATKKGSVHFGTLCCNQGEVKLNCYPLLHSPGDEMDDGDDANAARAAWNSMTQPQKDAANEFYHLFVDNTKEAIYLRSHIRKINAAMSMASLQVNDATVRGHGATGAFKVGGILYRRVGAVLPSTLAEPKFLQIYFLDPQYQAEMRASKFRDPTKPMTPKEHALHNIEISLFNKLQRLLTTMKNSYLESFLTAHEYVQQQHLNPDDLEIEIHPIDRPADEYKRGQIHPGRLHLPSVSEISILVPNAPHPDAERSIVCQMRQSIPGQDQLHFIKDGHRSYNAMAYPMLNPLGKNGFYFGMRSLASPFNKISINKYTRWNMMERSKEKNILHRSNALYQQWIVDSYAQAENERMGYVAREQPKLRGDTLSNVRQSLQNRNVKDSGRQTVVPSSFTGSDRWYNKKYDNAMALVKTYGKPHLFITFTFDVNCKEMKEHLLPGQSPYDRPDMITRIFQIKLTAFLNDIIKDGVFTVTKAELCPIEWQKRGAPHCHILLWLSEFDGLPSTIDKMISAEIPPEGSELFELVKKHMVHRCGPNCLVNGECKRHYPKEYSDTTVVGEGAFAKYRRRSPKNGGRSFWTYYNKQRVLIDNRDIVPYSPYLLLKYKSHVNAEDCASIAAVKYIIHYPLKGGDLMTVEEINNQDEITRYTTQRYISSCNACHGLFEFKRVVMKPSVLQLNLHLPQEQYIVYKPNPADAEAAVASKQTFSQLEAYFDANRLGHNNPESEYAIAVDTYYEDFPLHFVWNTTKQEHRWTRRTKNPQIGRMVSISPKSGDTYYLRMLLKHKKGAVSFQDLLRVNGRQCTTFKEACIAMELLQDDSQLIKCMEEAVLFKVAYALRDIFCCILLNCEPMDPRRMFDMFKEDMMEDFLYKRSHITNMSQDNKTKFAYNELLVCLNKLLEQGNKTNADYNLPTPETLQVNVTDNEMEYDPNAGTCYTTNRPLLNRQQQIVFTTLQQRIDQSLGGLYHIDAPAGTGKTFVGNTILDYIRKDLHIAIACATTGIAAILLHLGTTAHKRFKWPIPCLKGSVSSLKFDSKEAEIIRHAILIIIDEDSSLSAALLECLDKYLRELMDKDVIMGGKLVVLMGDFRQGLPVVRHGSRADIVSASVKSSPLWAQVTTLRLTQNMRVERLIRPDSSPSRIKELRDYAAWLLSVGNGTAPTVNNDILEIPNHMVCQYPLEVRNKVYNDFHVDDNYKNPSYLRQRAILSTTNDIIQQANYDMVKYQLAGNLTVSVSVDECIEDYDKTNYDTDFLNKIESPGIPPHRLALKPNACVILIRTLNLKHRHCNGTRCIIKEIKPHVLRATLLDGGNHSEIFIPKIPLICDNTDFPANFTRRQFPILGAYYLTFNRAQGQSLDRVGMILPHSVFTHGQLYTGNSRSGDPNHIFMWADQSEFEPLLNDGILDRTKTYTRNIVYKEILDNDNE